MIIGCSLLFVAALMIGLHVPLLRGKVKMNPLYGMRFKQSFTSEENWYAINRYGARLMIWWSIVILVVGLATFFIPLNDRSALAIGLAFVPLVVVIPAIQCYLFARQR
ncbi:MAG TPA: SdpI family protein [Rhodothermales bacterium]|nr:SdpI family protein [Rhodothermales bacterium]